MSAGALAAVALIVAVAGFAQTVAGFGFSLLAVPVLGLVVDPKDAVAISLVLLVVNSGLLTWNERHQIDRAAVWPLLAGALPGLPLGLLLLDAVSTDALRLALGIAVVASVAVLVSGAAVRSTGRAVELTAGLLTGILTTSLNTNGPPAVLALQARSLPPARFRPTASAVLALTGLVGVGLFAAAGRLGGPVAEALVPAAPGLAVGWLAGVRARRRVPAAVFRSLVLALLLAAAAASMTSALAGWLR